MQLRKNRFLKFFVTVLFMVEFLSPAFLIGSSPYVSGINRTFQLSTLTHHGFQLTLFSEQLNENEEERENYKCVSLPIDLYHNLAYSALHSCHQTDRLSIDSSLNSNKRPALFRLHCVIQI